MQQYIVRQGRWSNEVRKFEEVSLSCIEKSKKYDWQNTSEILQNIYKELVTD